MALVSHWWSSLLIKTVSGDGRWHRTWSASKVWMGTPSWSHKCIASLGAVWGDRKLSTTHKSFLSCKGCWCPKTEPRWTKTVLCHLNSESFEYRPIVQHCSININQLFWCFSLNLCECRSKPMAPREEDERNDRGRKLDLAIEAGRAGFSGALTSHFSHDQGLLRPMPHAYLLDS